MRSMVEGPTAKPAVFHRRPSTIASQWSPSPSKLGEELSYRSTRLYPCHTIDTGDQWRRPPTSPRSSSSNIWSR